MIKLRAGLSLLLLGVLGRAGFEGRAVASAMYSLTDLGTSNINNAPPSDQFYSAPQVDNSGAVHYGAGQTDAGSYHFATVKMPAFDGNLSPTALYGMSGSLPTQIYVPQTSYEQSYAGGINASGLAVGYTSPGVGDFSVIHTAFAYNPAGGPGQAGQLPGFSVIPGAYPGTFAWYALGVNATGSIVGVTAPPGTPANLFNDFLEGRAFVSDGKTTLDLNTLIAPGSGLTLISATSINDRGQIAGYAIGSDGSEHAYLLTPTATPEPGALAIAVAAFGYLGLRRLARRRADRCDSRLGA